MRGVISVTYMAHQEEYQVPIFDVGDPDPKVVMEREQRVRELIEKMGAKHLLHPAFKGSAVSKGGSL